MGFFKRFTRPKAELSLEVNKNQLLFGDELKGIVKVTSQEEFDIEEIIVSLNCSESIKKTRVRYSRSSVQSEEPQRRRSNMSMPEMPEMPSMTGRSRRRTYGNNVEGETENFETEEYWDTASLYSDHVKVSGSMPAIIGLNMDFPFVFKIPSIGRETYHSVDQNVRWSISTLMNIKNRKGMYSHGGGEILVTKPTVSTIPTKEVVREVVLMPCTYCSGLMPQTAIFCPNCGARRKN